MKSFARSPRLASHLQTALLLVAGCSFQTFDYLEDGAGGSSSSTAGRNGAGSGTSNDSGSGGSQSGGSDTTPQGGEPDPGGGGKSTSSAGQPSKGGKGGETVADAGEGNAPQAGAGGAAGSSTGGTKPTGELVNPSFETGTTTGWQVDPADALAAKHAFVQWAQGGGTVPDGKNEFGIWNAKDTYTVDLHQTIEGLEDGTYTFKGYFNRGALTAAWIFARECGGTDPEPMPVPLTEPAQWLAVSLPGIEVVGGTCQVGLHVEAEPENWLNADLFSFEKDAE